jgi:hypothetical protein
MREQILEGGCQAGWLGINPRLCSLSPKPYEQSVARTIVTLAFNALSLLYGLSSDSFLIDSADETP